MVIDVKVMVELVSWYLHVCDKTFIFKVFGMTDTLPIQLWSAVVEMTTMTYFLLFKQYTCTQCIDVRSGISPRDPSNESLS